ncbi:hypothetical protein JTE90_029315 [Oedothorax gibbosus]|uniref:Uncharacterized protein n=1 Tax=Oedothorax gibbosus TaxID=931172 RepID=A0AAV6UJ70_9ARAC|nr:hypothetical protein JTE90_029315 [Oedothorax gibbosus]
MAQTPDIVKILEEDIKQAVHEVMNLNTDSLLVIGVLILACIFSIFAVKRRMEREERTKEMMNSMREKKTE